ncbi:MAG: BTAD domain-containing putative transcriptional regulator [Chloroflexota bacterium]
MILLQTKFLIPRFTTGQITRPHLTEIMRANPDQRIVMLVAPPGYGKTMLMADAVAALDCPVLWYQLDEGDSDPATFIAYLIEGLCQTLPQHGERIRDLLKDSGSYPPERALVIIQNELLKLKSRWLLVLDDYHLITSAAVHQLTTSLLENAPANLSLMLASRGLPPLPLGRWRARGLLLELRAEQLRFSVDEAAQWLAKRNHSLSEAELQQLVDRTEGWGAGIQLVLTLLSEPNQHGAAFWQQLSGAHQRIFNYLMEEVFSRQSPEMQQFLLDSSVLMRMNLETCKSVIGAFDAHRMLEQIETESLFLVSLDNERQWFRYHDLFREFLLEKLARENPDRLLTLRQCATRYYEVRGEYEIALQYALLANDDAQAVQILAAFALDWLELGRVGVLNRYFSQLEAAVQNMPELLLVYGKVLRQMGHLNESYRRFQQAYTQALRCGSEDAASNALTELASLARSQGDYLRAQQHAAAAVSLHAHTNHKTRAFALMEYAKSQGFLEGMNLGSTLAREAVAEMELAGALISPFEQAQLLRSLAQICWWHGDVTATIAHGQEALRRIPNARAPLAAEIMMTLATPCLYRHEYQVALNYAEQALAICQQLDVRELLPTAYTTLGNILTRTGKLDEAEQALRQGIEQATHLGAERYAQVMAAGYLAYNLFTHERIQEAIQVAETALWSIEGLPIVYEIYVCRSVLADSYLSDGQTLRAERIFEALIELGEQRQYNIPLSMAYFGLAYIRLKAGDQERGIPLARRSLELLEASRAWELYVDQGERAQTICALLAEMMPDNLFIRQVLKTLGASASGVPLTAAPERFRVQTLGGFRVFRGDQELPPKAWVSTKARDLLAYFITNRHEYITLDRALDAIWSADGERGSTAFHTALYRLRGALHSAGEKTKYIRVEGGAYTLDAEHFDIDVDRLSLLIQQARAAPYPESAVLYEQAISLYKGDYLENLTYFWVYAEQERIKELLLHALQALEQLHVQQHNLEQALNCAQRQLLINPLQESLHCTIMRYFASGNNRAGLVAQYRQLQSLLHDELGTRPSPATEQLFLAFMNGASAP